MTDETLTLSIAAPAYNEAENLPVVIPQWVTYLQSLSEIAAFEIVICNDGSRDRTGEVLDELSRQYAQVKPVTHFVNQGATVALATAIAHTKLDWVLLLDSDGQFPVENLKNALDCLARQKPQAIIGCRTNKEDTLFARFGSSASGALCNFFHGTHLRDFNSAFKLVCGDLLRSLTIEAKGLNYSTEITSKLLEHGIPLAEVDVRHIAREKGVSSLKAFKGAFHRLLFVMYIGVRQMLFYFEVLRRPKWEKK